MPSARLIRAAALAVALTCAAIVSAAPAALARVASPKARTAHTRAAHHGRTHSKRACARRASYYHAHGRKSHHRCRAHHKRHKRANHRSAGSKAPAPVNRTAAAGVPQCANAGLTPSETNIALMREATLCLVNRERAQHGESALVPNAALESSAQGHSESMAANSYFEHVAPGGITPLDRMRSAGYITGARGFEVGENIAWGTLWLGSPRAIVAGWMASPGHRANILDAHFRDTGVGVSAHVPRAWGHGQAGGIFTQDFGVRG